MIKIRLIFPNPGRKQPFVINGDFIGDINGLKRLWDAEQAINGLTNIKMHIELTEPEKTNG